MLLAYPLLPNSMPKVIVHGAAGDGEVPAARWAP